MIFIIGVNQLAKISNFLTQLKNAKRLIRMTIVGDGAVGKTTLVQAMLQKTTEYNHNNHKLIDEKKITRTPFMEIESWTYKDLVFQCYDLAGQRTPGIHPLDILKNSVLSYIDIYIFVFSIDRYESFENLSNWLRLMDLDSRFKHNNIGFILVGNKIDLERCVSKELVHTLVGQDKFFHSYVETSAIKPFVGIDKVLEEIVGMGKKLLNLCD
ncbi:MAG: ADP-ribosylation factor-like protein [Candidatus Hodarchaeota archaeon]